MIWFVIEDLDDETGNSLHRHKHALSFQRILNQQFRLMDTPLQGLTLLGKETKVHDHVPTSISTLPDALWLNWFSFIEEGRRKLCSLLRLCKGHASRWWQLANEWGATSGIHSLRDQPSKSSKSFLNIFKASFACPEPMLMISHSSLSSSTYLWLGTLLWIITSCSLSMKHDGKLHYGISIYQNRGISA